MHVNADEEMEFGGMGLRIQLAAADLAAHSHQGGSERRL